MTAPAGRFHLAFNQPSLTWAPVWTRIDSNPNLVTSIQIDRGRLYEVDRTDTSRATVQVADTAGLLDPNGDAPISTHIEPLTQALICLQNPVTGVWEQRFRGFVESWDYTIDPSQKVAYLTVTLTDIFEFLSAIEMFPGSPGFGVAPPDVSSAADVYYPPERMDVRVIHVLDDAIGPLARADYAVVFSGNVNVKGQVYSAGESAMTAVQEAVDAEFPNVANVYTDRFGRLAVHGRIAKFDPASVLAGAAAGAWDYHEWNAGDGAAVNAYGGYVQVRRFGYSRGLAKIINQAVATPHRTSTPLTNAEIVANTVIDSASIAKYGIRSWSALDLITDYGLLDSSGDLAETRKFAVYYVDNYKAPQNRITDIGFRSLDPSDPRAPQLWNLLTQVDVSDLVTVRVSFPGGGGVAFDEYYVEGVHETITPLQPGYDDVTTTLDLSPKAYFDTNPFPTS